MTDWGEYGTVIDVGYGVVPGSATRANPRKPQLGSGPGRIAPSLPVALPQHVRERGVAWGLRRIWEMLADPAVSSSYRSLKFGVMDGDLQLTPAIKISAAKTRPGAAPGAAGDKEDAGGQPVQAATKMTPDEAMALEVARFDEMILGRKDDLRSWLLQLLDGMALGVKLAEVTDEPIEGGEFAGKMGLGSLNVLPQWAWQFVVDPFWRVDGIVGYSPATGAMVKLPPEKFCWLTWGMKDGDPRGDSIFRAADSAWTMKEQAKPELYQYLLRWGQPGLSYIMAEGDDREYELVDAAGHPTGTFVPAEQWHLQQLLNYRGGSVFVGPYGSALNVHEPAGAGEVFWALFDWADRQICLAIEGAARARLEAKNGSKADSQGGQDESGLVKSEARRTLCAMIRKLLRRINRDNYGPDIADRYTPLVKLGNAEQQDRAALWGAVAGLYSANAVGDSQKADLAAEVGLPVPDVAADQAADQARQERQAALTKPAPGEPGNPPSKPSDATRKPPAGKEKAK